MSKRVGIGAVGAQWIARGVSSFSVYIVQPSVIPRIPSTQPPSTQLPSTQLHTSRWNGRDRGPRLLPVRHRVPRPERGGEFWSQSNPERRSELSRRLVLHTPLLLGERRQAGEVVGVVEFVRYYNTIINNIYYY